jgi:hypothetical protein
MRSQLYLCLRCNHEVRQFFVGCSVEPRLLMEAINDMWALTETCREAFECTNSAP